MCNSTAIWSELVVASLVRGFVTGLEVVFSGSEKCKILPAIPALSILVCSAIGAELLGYQKDIWCL